jgi:hypothetical protein
MSDEGRRDQGEQPLPCGSNQMDVDALLQLLSGQVGLANQAQERPMQTEWCFTETMIQSNSYEHVCGLYGFVWWRKPSCSQPTFAACRRSVAIVDA